MHFSDELRSSCGRRKLLLLLLCSLVSAPLLASADQPVSFQNDVMAVLSKAGCNAGTCHGNKNGKGGFKLSLRGQDPDLDYTTLTHDYFARRVDPFTPANSLILLKPTTQIAHEGGLRFKTNSIEYDKLVRWIGDGLKSDLATAPKLQNIEVSPAQSVLIEPLTNIQLYVQAKFSDGSTRDITSLAVYDTSNPLAKVSHDGLVEREGIGETTILIRYLQTQEPVRIAFVPARPDFRWTEIPSNNYIDDHILTKLRTLRMNPSPLCSDEIFLRRACLDLLGLLPTRQKTHQFLNSRSRSRVAGETQISPARPHEESQSLSTPTSEGSFPHRAALIDRLLQRPEFADYWALKWADLLRVEAHSLDQKGVVAFHRWIRDGIATNKPLDQFVRELITARGSTYATPAANYYRPTRDPIARGKAAAQIFLGARLQCAECHNHPSDRWTQDDYYDWATLFAPVGYKVIQNDREISSDEHEWKGEQIIFIKHNASVTNPRTGSAAHPRFLGVKEPASDDTDSLQALAQWLTSPDNRAFARVQVNRIWFQLMGRGLVDPPDDFRATNPPSHPELLDALADDFVKHNFDVRYLVRLIMNSRAYQLSSESNDTNESDQINYSHNLIRRLGAEQMLDSQSEVAAVPLHFSGYPVGMRAAQLPGVRPESKGKRRANQLDQFLEIFGKPPRLLTTDTERSCECNMGQAFQMLSGPTVNQLLEQKENRVTRLLAEKKSNKEIIQELYWTALTRPPNDQELAALLSTIDSSKTPRPELEDILWALLNSKEFLFRP
jgi:hypothetical protein